MCEFFQLWSFKNYTSKFRSHLRHKISCPFSPSSSILLLLPPSSYPWLPIVVYRGELLLDSSSPWSGVSSQLFFLSIPLSLKFKKQRTPLMKKIQGLQAPHGAASFFLLHAGRSTLVQSTWILVNMQEDRRPTSSTWILINMQEDWSVQTHYSLVQSSPVSSFSYSSTLLHHTHFHMVSNPTLWYVWFWLFSIDPIWFYTSKSIL